MRIFLTVNWLIILQTIIIQVLFWMQSILGRMFPVDIILILRSTGLFSIDAGVGKHTYLLQESGKTINVDAKIKQLNDINWIEIGYKEGNTFSVYGKEYAIDSSGHINVSAEDEFTSTEIKYPSRSI